MSTIKHPWRVEYEQRFPDWDRHAMPHVVGADGDLVARPPQFVDHPGKRDILAEMVCNLIVRAVNEYIERRK